MKIRFAVGPNYKNVKSYDLFSFAHSKKIIISPWSLQLQCRTGIDRKYIARSKCIRDNL